MTVEPAPDARDATNRALPIRDNLTEAQKALETLSALNWAQREFTLHCRDRRWCANATFTVTAPDEDQAHMLARAAGWLVYPANDQVTCPACQAGTHPRRNP